MAVANVRSTAAWTLPSHMAMFTGQLARGVGLGQAPGRARTSAAPVVRAQQDRLLAEVLRRAGYATARRHHKRVGGQGSGFDTGFEEFVELDVSRQNVLGGGLRRRLALGLGGGAGACATTAPPKAEESFAALDRASSTSRPFFWFVNLVECHSPTSRRALLRDLGLDAAAGGRRGVSLPDFRRRSLRAWLGKITACPEGAIAGCGAVRGVVAVRRRWLGRCWTR